MIYWAQTILLYSVYNIIGILLLIILYYAYIFQHWKKLNVPHIKPNFPFGNMSAMFSQGIEKIFADIHLKMKEQGHEFCGVYMFTMPVFMPIAPNIIKHLLTINFNKFNDRGFHLDEKYDPMGVSIVTTSGEKWKSIRTKIAPVWTILKTKMMSSIVIEKTQELKEIIDDAVNKGEPIDATDICRRFTVDVICSSVLGVEGGSLKNRNSEFYLHAKKLFQTNFSTYMRVTIGTLFPTIHKIFKIQLFDPVVTNFFRKVVYDTVAYREQNNIQREDTLDLLIKLKNRKSINNNEKNTHKISEDESLTLNEVASQCFVFFVGGYETSSKAINFMLYELAKNQDIQNRTRENIIETLNTSNSDLNYEVIQNMRYLDNVFYETLRMYPLVHMLNRICCEDFTIPNTNITIKKGTRVLLSTLGLHWDPEFYPNPEVFDPDRFTDKAKLSRPSNSYLPFSDGPRICPGQRFATMEVKLCVASLLLNYRIKPHPNSEEINLCSMANLLSTKKPILLNFERI